MNKNSNQNENKEDSEKFIKMEMQDTIYKNKLIKDSKKNSEIMFSKLDENLNDNEEIFLDYNKKNFSNQFSNVIKNILIKFKKKIKNIKKKEKITFLFLIISIFLYIIGLKGCHGDEVYCLEKMGISYFIKVVIINVISCIIVSNVLILITFRKVSSYHLLYLIPCFVILFYYDQGTTLASHGYYNCLGYIAFLLFFYPFFIFVYFMIVLIRKKKYKLFISIFIVLFILFISFNIYIQVKTRCDGWDIGLNNTRIYNNEEEYACRINIPKKCYINIFDGKLNVSDFLNLECNKRDFKEKKLLFEYIKKMNNPYIKSNAKRIGYPHLNKGDFPENKQDGMKKLSKEVVYNLVDMDNLPPHLTEDKIPETYVDFNDYPDDPNSKYGKLHFNLKKNKTLVKERKKNAKKTKVIFENIIIIFIDTVSRAHLMRKMPKFKAWLEKFMKYDSKDFINYQFLKYHSVGVHTLLNLKPIIFGESSLSPNGVNILNYMKEKGYITAQADNYCGTQPYQIRPSFENSNLTLGYFDHELISLFCEPNYFVPENPFPLNKGNCAILRRCLYGYDTFYHLFNYSKLFWRTYKDNRKYLRLSSMDSHEGTGELISLMDQPLVDFLDDLYKNGDLKDTALFMFSDHGNHISPHLSLMPSGDVEIEKIMPFFFILLPKKNKDYKNELFLDEFYENLYKNQQSLVTCYDIHDTMIHIIFNEGDPNKAPYTKNGISLFNLVNNKNRTCDNYPEIIEKRSPGTLTCNCYKY